MFITDCFDLVVLAVDCVVYRAVSQLFTRGLVTRLRPDVEEFFYV